MDELILDQAPDLAIDHPVELGDQDDIIAQMTMQRKKAKPFITADFLPFPGIKEQLTLINHKQNRSFLDPFITEVLPAVLDQELRSHLVIGAVGECSTFMHTQIHREITDHWVAEPGPVLNCPGTMQALAGARCSAVQADHISHRSLSASA